MRPSPKASCASSPVVPSQPIHAAVRSKCSISGWIAVTSPPGLGSHDTMPSASTDRRSGNRLATITS
jgi:hypothetical protein